MKLGILVNTDKHLDTIRGLAKAAQAKGHEVSIFAMDIGTKLLENPLYTELSGLERVKMSFCSHNAEGNGVKTDGLPEQVVKGSQYDNAVMNNSVDKIIVL